MSTRKPSAILVSLASVVLLSACDVLASFEPPLQPATDVCTDLGADQCRRPNPDDLTKS